MDLYYSKPEDSQSIILDNLSVINDINSKNFNSSIINIFINAKANEITNIFKGASLNTKREAYNIMTELSPSNSDLSTEYYNKMTPRKIDSNFYRNMLHIIDIMGLKKL